MPAVLTQLVYLKYRAGEIDFVQAPIVRYRVRPETTTLWRSRTEADTTMRNTVGTRTTHRSRVQADNRG